MIEKNIAEEDLKGLENEIEEAVDRLFVEKGKKPIKTEGTVSLSSEPAREPEKERKWETIQVPASAPQPFPSLEGLETQLLSLEWEISKENLEKTLEQVLNLRDEFKGDPEITSVLNRMLRTIHYMIQNEDQIRPHLLQFLIDSKETLKWLLGKTTVENVSIYKKLAVSGIEAKFACLEEFSESKPKPPSSRIEMPAQTPVSFSMGSELIEEILEKTKSLSERLDRLMEKMDRHLSAHDRIAERSLSHIETQTPMRMKVTIFKIGERLYGVESEQVMKLFKIPDALFNKMDQLRKFRLKEFDVRMIDLENIFRIPEEDRGEGKQVLILKGNGEYKGVRMDRVLNRLSGPLEQEEESKEYILGMMRWTYQDFPIKVPIIDFTKL